MSFGIKLALFLAIALAVILGGTGFATYTSIRGTLIHDGEMQVTASAGRFVRQLNEIGQQVAFGVSILSLDFPLRRAVAEHDHDTVLSALRNHGRRVGASRVLLVETDGRISIDTADRADTAGQFPYPPLLRRAAEEGRVATVVVIDGTVDWLVVVPVLAPEPIAYVAMLLPLNDQVLERIRAVTGLPEATGLAIDTVGGNWIAVAGPIAGQLARYLPAPIAALPRSPDILVGGGEEAIVLASVLATPRGSPAVAAVFFYPLSEALRRYHRLTLILLGGLGGGLVAAVLGAWLVVRGVARPLEQLARYAQRVGEGEYAPPPRLRRVDEIGQLSSALGSMAHAIAEREKRIHHQTSHDMVTNLPNRQALLREIAAYPLSQPSALLVIGLVRLQEIANTVGRDIAEHMMHDAATRLAVLLGSARLSCIGERSFAAFLPGCDVASAQAVARQVVELFDQPYRQGELTIDVSVAVGIAASPLHGSEAELLLRRAEVAWQAALHVDARVDAYRGESDPHLPERLSLMSELRHGLEHGELRLVYQPKLDMRTGRIAGAEALVRWHHPTRGLILPDAFTALAEETGNIQYLTRWVLRTGLAEVARWQAQGLPLRVSINISVRDLADSELPAQVAALLQAHALPGEALVLELTEGAIMREPEAAIAVLRRLADLGITVSIDDFGVGQSSLSYLRRLPVGELKIDKAFVLRLPRSPDDQTIVRSVIELAHNLGYLATAEGVEDAASLDLLRRFGCDYAQGYLIARPLPSDEFPGFVRRWSRETLPVTVP